MSTQTSKEVSCPHCGAAVKTPMWPGINAKENPELRGRVLDETLFDWECPECGYRARLMYPCLYHDPDRGFMVYAVPNGSGREFQPVDVAEKFPQLVGLKKRVVPTLAQLKEKVLIFEAGLDDIAVELVKYALAGVLREKYGKKTENGYFCYADEAENRIGFSFFLEGSDEPVQKSTRMDAYRKTLEIVNYAQNSADGGCFEPVDAVTAEKILEEYREETAQAEEE